jgi:hypothetical protein
MAVWVERLVTAHHHLPAVLAARERQAVQAALLMAEV